MLANSLDVYVLLKLAVRPEGWTYAELAKELLISPSELHQSIRRSREAGLLMPDSVKIRRQPLWEYLVYGVRYAFPSVSGALQYGLPTSHAAPPLDKLFPQDDKIVPVWPDEMGKAYGYAVAPLHPKAPQASRLDPQFYEWLALTDAIRCGRTRERNAAISILEDRLLKHEHTTGRAA